jgi:hypothetical protein
MERYLYIVLRASGLAGVPAKKKPNICLKEQVK